MSASFHSPPLVDRSDYLGDHAHAPGARLQSQDLGHVHSSPSSMLTRTVAIIKTRALNQRLEIEPRILEANFEIVKERQMEFDTETEPETFYELFGDDTRFLGQGPVWVYVLERRRAVSVLLSLIPSLNGAVIGAKSEAQAEMLISALFVSSPPFPISDLPSVAGDGEFDSRSIRSVNSAVLEALQLGLETPLGPTHALSPSPGSSDAAQFRARPLPKTHLTPDIAPRLTKAALLRQGIATDGSPRSEPKTRMSLASTGRIPLPRKDKENEAAEKEREKERARKTFAGVPGHKRVDTITVASTAPPAITPRMTKAAALRLGLEQPATPPGKKRMSISGPPPRGAGHVNGGGVKSGSLAMSQKGSETSANEADGEETETEVKVKKDIFEGVPGHKRRESFSVASTKSPTIAPRLNRSAALRKEGAAPPSSFMFRLPTEPKMPGSGMHSRSSSVMSAYRDTGDAPWGRPHSAMPPRAASRTSNAGAPMIQKTLSYSSQTSSSGTGTGPLSTASTTSNDSDEPPSNGVTSPTRKARRLSSLQAPTIAPRANKSALLRAQKQAVDAAKPKSPWANASKR
ncbi:hypothetical protein JVT61DRAFT_11776 [Boletus reticuloceps]|uniref:Nucleoside diphosphate kinase n=1 Tax=Boletus reticuloceps TaxID=495285 RepID=A0A8I2YWH8_9AGAM|nr:hypothetical protein JVT61DRAFT_11776 [Boletus reticuloceps]